MYACTFWRLKLWLVMRLTEEKGSSRLADLSSAQQQWDAFPEVFALKHAPPPLQGSATASFIPLGL